MMHSDFLEGYILGQVWSSEVSFWSFHLYGLVVVTILN